MAKRSRELARQQKKEEKQERQEAKGDGEPKLNPDDESVLLEEFARLNDEFAAEQGESEPFHRGATPNSRRPRHRVRRGRLDLPT